MMLGIVRNPCSDINDKLKIVAAVLILVYAVYL
jgi:hypothetical protein